MQVHVDRHPYSGYYAIDLDSYDGTPDAGAQLIGHGADKKEALEDMYDSALHSEDYSKEDLAKIREAINKEQA